MAEIVFTIPINEAFDEYDGCPLCRLKRRLEEGTLEYTLGAAMMEPDVRIEMNRLGFCTEHLHALSVRKNKLALALIFESQLDELANQFSAPAVGGKKGLFAKKQSGVDAAERLKQFSESCFVCRKIKHTEQRYCSNIAYLWEQKPEFREKLKRQPYFCMNHSAMLLNICASALKEADYKSLYDALLSILSRYVQSLRENITEFTVSFDHRNAGKPLSEAARSSIERSIQWLE